VRPLHITSSILIGIAAAGCSKLPPPYIPPHTEIETSWHSQSTDNMHSCAVDDIVWWQELNDSLLTSLLERAFVQNLDLATIQLRIEEARIQQTGAAASLYPRVDATVSGGRVNYPRGALVKDVLRQHGHGKTYNGVNFFECGFDALWEIDLFGVAAYQERAAAAHTQATEESLQDAWVALSAEVAKNYINLRMLQAHLHLAQIDDALALDDISLVKTQLDIDYASGITVAEAEEQQQRLSIRKPQIEEAISKAQYRIATLLGMQPGELCNELNDINQLPKLPFDQPLGIPSDLLRRRPDIRQAEREFAVATEQVGSAIAELFPRLSLRGFIGDIATHISSLFSSGGCTWFLQPQLLAPIFNSRLLQQDVAISELKAERAYYHYRKTVLAALEEAENAIGATNAACQQHYHLVQAEAAAADILEMTRALYTQGLRDYRSVIAAEQRANNAQKTVIESHATLLLNYVALYKALGGSFCLPEISQDP
jgi:multidrug efflux system outer membrane protein